VRARAGGVRGAFGPPSRNYSPVDKVDLALQLTAYIHCDSTLRNASLTGGVVAGGGPEAPLAPPARARVCVCVHIHL